MTANALRLVADHPFLAGLERSWLEQLALMARPMRYGTRFRLFREDGPAQHFWLLTAGLVALDLHVPGRGDVVIETIGAPGAIGVSWLFPPYRWRFGAVTIEPTETIEFDAAGVRLMMEDDLYLGRDLTNRFLAVIFDRLGATRLRLLDLYATAAEGMSCRGQ